MMPHNTIETALYYIAIFQKRHLKAHSDTKSGVKMASLKQYQMLAGVGKAILIMYISALD